MRDASRAGWPGDHVMFDPAIMITLQIPPAPEPPRVVQERMWLSDLGQSAQRRSKQLADHYKAQADAWLGQISASVDQYRLVAMEAMEPSVVALLDETIVEVEAEAERRARARAWLRKRSARDIKRHFAVDPSLGAVSRAFANKLLATDDRIVQAFLDHAIFLRAIRAQRDPTRKPGPVFETASDLRSALQRALAA